jgi:hypothetical protein
MEQHPTNPALGQRLMVEPCTAMQFNCAWAVSAALGVHGANAEHVGAPASDV